MSRRKIKGLETRKAKQKLFRGGLTKEAWTKFCEGLAANQRRRKALMGPPTQTGYTPPDMVWDEEIQAYVDGVDPDDYPDGHPEDPTCPAV